jgi:hypothetical protein
MKKIAFLLTLLIIASSLFGQEFTFQGLPWGSTKEQVIEKIGKPTMESENRITYYNILLAGYKAKLDISFENGFNAAVYTIDEPFDIGGYWQIYETIKKKMEEKYGRPTADKIPGKYLSGGYPYFTIWNLVDSYIGILIDEDFRLDIVYLSDNAWEAENADELLDYKPPREFEL